MSKGISAIFREATKGDIAFLSHILVTAAEASGVSISIADLPTMPDTYQYVDGFPTKRDVGIIAKTNEGILIGAAWLRLLPTDAHAVNEQLPELTMGIIPEYQRMGVGTLVLKELYKAALGIGISKISLGVHKDNIAAVSLYKQQNWIEDGYYHEYIMMSKEINANFA